MYIFVITNFDVKTIQIYSWIGRNLGLFHRRQDLSATET